MAQTVNKRITNFKIDIINFEGGRGDIIDLGNRGKLREEQTHIRPFSSLIKEEGGCRLEFYSSHL